MRKKMRKVPHARFTLSTVDTSDGRVRVRSCRKRVNGGNAAQTAPWLPVPLGKCG